MLLQLTRRVRFALVIIVFRLGLAHHLRLNGALDAGGGDIPVAVLGEADVAAMCVAVSVVAVAVAFAGPRVDHGGHFLRRPAVPVVRVGLVVGARLVRVRGAHHPRDHVGDVHLDVQLDQVDEGVELDVDDAVGEGHDADEDDLREWLAFWVRVENERLGARLTSSANEMAIMARLKRNSTLYLVRPLAMSLARMRWIK